MAEDTNKLIKRAGGIIDAEPVEDDGNDHLRADILGSIAGSNPNDPNYLGRINHLVTAHGAVSGSAMRPPSSMNAPDIGAPTPGAPPEGFTSDLSLPATMAPARPGKSLLGRIGGVAARMGNIAGDIFAPGITALIPGTDLNKRLREIGEEQKGERLRKIATEEEGAKARTSEAETKAKLEPSEEEKNRAEAQAALKGKPGLTPEEQFMNDALHGGPNGGPKPDPQGQPWNYLSAHRAWKEQETEAKPEPKVGDQDKYVQDYLAANKLQDTPANRNRAVERYKTLGPYATAAAQAPTKSTERSDKSYQFNSTQLEKIRTPIESRTEKIGIALDNLNKGTPAADALAAPEILSAMVGGQGSGLRMNEAEISRVVGGKNKWEQLKSKINAWQTDPSKPFLITPAQRQQFRAILQAGQTKITAKMKAIEDAEGSLLNSDDPQEHRKILTDTRKILDGIDEGKKVTRVNGEIKVGE